VPEDRREIGRVRVDVGVEIERLPSGGGLGIVLLLILRLADLRFDMGVRLILTNFERSVKPL
jgi:hypothetical protein